MLQELPLPVLGASLRWAAASPGFHRLAPVVNLVCHAAHDALPDAFACAADPADAAAAADDDDDDGGQGGPVTGDPDPVVSLLSKDSTRHPRGAQPVSPVLTLDLTCLGRAAFAPGAASNLVRTTSLRRTAQRFARAQSVRLSARLPYGELGSALFAEHAAPHLVGVPSLAISGPWHISLAPFWQFESFSGLAAGVRELHLEGHHGTLVPLAAQLSDTFPCATAVRLVLYTDDFDDRQCRRPVTTGFSSLTLRASPQLTTLLLSVKMPDGDDYCCGNDSDASVDDGILSLPDDPFTLTITGDPCGLHTLHLDTWTLSGDFRGSDCRPWLLAGALSALHTLDVTLRPSQRPDDPELPYSTPVLKTCPLLRTLVLRTDDFTGVPDWQAVVLALEPLAGTLTRVELHHTYTPASRAAYRSMGALGPLLNSSLPSAQLHVIENDFQA